MNNLNTSRPGLQDGLITWIAGFAGAFFAFMLLPRTLKFMLKRFTFGLISEVVVVVLAGLLTEKAAEKATHESRRH